MVKANLGICLFVTACVPARLETVLAGKRANAIIPSDLSNALDGAQDAAAKRSLGNWIAENFKASPPSSPAGYQVNFAITGPGVYLPGYFDRLEPTFRYKVTGLKNHSIDGIGVPLTGIRENRHRGPVEKWYPPEGVTRAVTAVAVPGSTHNRVRRVEIRLIDRNHTETYGKYPADLAGNFTVPYAALLTKAGSLDLSGITAIFSIMPNRKPAFYLLATYDPNRTPVIFIHGLISTPLAWAELTNELWAVPEIRRRYQIWHYLYPTNPPALYSARIMRGQLDELRHFLDPAGNNPAMQRTVLVTHSMGGLLGKTLAIEPKGAFWDAVFTRPLSSMNVTPAERDTLIEAFYWKPRGNVDRIIFCSVPFRGSNLAISWIGRFITAFIAPSREFEDFFREVGRKNPGIYQPDYVSLAKGKVTSVTTLAPHMKSMEILDQVPLTLGTKVHIITGSMDFVVNRSSATVADAESNIEVPAGHGSFHHPKAIAEIIRILKLPDAR